MTKPRMISIPIDGIPTTLVDDNGKYYVYLRPIIEDIGLSWKRQFAKLCARGDIYDWRYFVSGRDDVYRCIALDDLSDFLDTVNPTSVAPTIWQRLRYYQTDWLLQIRQHLRKQSSGGNALYELLRAIGFNDTVLMHMGLIGA